MLVKVDCALITCRQGVYSKACYLNVIQIRIYLHLPIFLNNYSQSIPHFLGISFVFASHLNQNNISGSKKYIILNAFQQQNYALHVYNCIIIQILISWKPWLHVHCIIKCNFYTWFPGEEIFRTNRPKICKNCPFTQNLLTRKEIRWKS